MKHFKLAAALVLASILLATPVLAATGQDSDTLADWGITVQQPDHSTAILDGSDGCYYIYPDTPSSIPYVMLYVYDGFENEQTLVDEFLNDLMADKYSDIEILKDLSPVTIGDKDGYEIDYGYTVEGYNLLDRRILIEKNDRIYMFVSKEIEELDMTVGTLLEDTVATSVFTDDEDIELPKDDDSKYEQILTWEDALEHYDEDEIDGEFVQFPEHGFELFIPSEYEEAQLPAEYDQYGYIGYFTPDAEALTPAISVQFMDKFGITDMQGYKDLLQQFNDSGIVDTGEVHTILINGIECLTYELDMTNSIVIGTVMDGGVVEISYTFSEDEGGMDMEQLSACSLRMIEENDDEQVILENDDIVTDQDTESDANELIDMLSQFFEQWKED